MKYIIFIINCFFCLQSEAQTELWGMTSGGGQYGAGTIFKTDGSGNNLTVEHSFYQIEGANPGRTKLIQATDGMLYGTTSAGGTKGLGIIYQFDPVSNIYSKKHEFTLTVNGRNPKGSLLQATDGKLYGVASGGTVTPGIYGVLYQYDISTNTYTKKFDFSTVSGSFPTGTLLQYSDGNIYGMTFNGGSNSKGVIFQYDPVTNIYTKKIDFAGVANGSNPYGELMLASDGNLYGMTSTGGANNKGTIFKYDPITNVLAKKFDFDGSVSGSTPYGTLTEATDGMLYGMTNDGGTNNYGIIFQYDPINEIFTKKIDFTGPNGMLPNGSLMQASDGKLYGMTKLGGMVMGNGILFQYDPLTNTLVNKFEFDNGLHGGEPLSTFMQALDGKLYGLSENGINYAGVMFQYDITTSILDTKIAFTESLSGGKPAGKLLKASDGTLYGITPLGGSINKGVLFQYNPITHIYTNKMEFDYNTTGGSPTSALIQTPDGMLYGTTRDGGTNNTGVIFQYDPINNIYTNKYNFIQTVTGQTAWGGLFLATDGNMYGMTYNGGANSDGTLYQFNPNLNSCTKKIDFDQPTSGYHCTGNLMLASNGKLYGTVLGGGLYTGTLFEYDCLTDNFSKKDDFNDALTGALPQGELVQALDGNLYGMTNLGGINNLGVLFQYNLSTNTIIKMFDFDGVNNGSRPAGSLVLASDGNLYGMTLSGGTNNIGVLFQYNPITNTYVKKFDFSTSVGGPANPNNGLIEIPTTSTNLKEETVAGKIKIFPNPSGGMLNMETSTQFNMENNKRQLRIKITDLLGKEVLYEVYKEKIDISNLQNGIYFLSLFDENRVIETQKVIINK